MIYAYIGELLNYAEEKGLILPCDRIVARNMLLSALKLSNWLEPRIRIEYSAVDELLDAICDYAAENGIIENTAAQRDLFDTRIMGLLTPMPREINNTFTEKYSASPKDATDWYYKFSRDTNYVRAGRIAKDIRYKHETDYGTLDITINLSKPEKDPRDIAAAKNSPAVKYPACQLCAENMGFEGTLTHPARQNLRPVPITAGGEDWFLQYSPYGYYNEHCIVFNSRHVPMKIDKAAFMKLFDIIEYLPHYFVGSNADLPIVGGSILSHEHFQGGNYTFAMEKAPIESEFELNGFDNVKAGTVKWFMSVIRLKSPDRESLADACDYILKSWREYTDEQAFIYAYTDNTPHNTITPIARMRDGEFECDLVLRNNITTEERPLGVYHPNPTLHHIKKENIGLIEVMGLAVLPSRLKAETESLAPLLAKGDIAAVRADKTLSKHGDWAERILAENTVTADNAMEIIYREIGKVFEEVLSDAGVFKRTDEGKQAFMRFVNRIGKA